MRVLIAALAFSVISFVIGVAGDLSVAAQAAPSVPSASARIAIPPARIETVALTAEVMKSSRIPLMASAPIVVGLAFEESNSEYAALDAPDFGG